MTPLIPHPQQTLPDPFKALVVAGRFARLGDAAFDIRFQLHDPQRAVAGSLTDGRWREAELQRRNELWRSTCFEAFWSPRGEERYWELNVSPRGEWNVYGFDHYRQPQPPRESADFQLSQLTTWSGEMICELKILNPALARIPDWDFSLCAVLQSKDDARNLYYATAHAGEKPDYHLRGSLRPV